MKLNARRTVLVGLAFLSISAFWQAYDNVVPLVLKNTFDMPDDIAGVIMALDNVLALFLLPFFGKLSDSCRTPIGKRMPFILGGTAVAVVLMNLLPMADRTHNLVLFMLALGMLLIAMGTYRSPAVALMPDVTPKPLRSKGNAIINLMGALGGVFTLAMTSLLVSKDASGREDYALLFFAVAVLMAVAVIVLLITIRENRLAAEASAINDRLDREAPSAEQPMPVARASGFHALPAGLRRSLLLILCSVSLWYMGYNAVTTAFTKYMSVQWGYDIKAASQCLMVATVAAVLSYIPIGSLSAHFGRKRMIQCGVAVLAGSFAVSALFATFHPLAYLIFALVGISWSMINVNSYPMVVEISRSSEVGMFTGYYYTFSMAAQIATPILSGWLLEHVGYVTLFPYAALMVAASFVTISFARHGDNRPTKPASRLEAFDAGDD